MTSDVQPPAVVVMGVSGSGKTTVGRQLAERLGVAFVDADDLHPESNRQKMAGGTPLTDHDRWPWLDAVARTVSACLGSGRGIVVACSALRRSYRDALRAGAGADVVFAHLTGSADLLHARMAARPGHFMPPALLRSQLETLEPLELDEAGMAFPVVEDPASIASGIEDWLASRERIVA
ncbi:gluconokinase [Leifsonia sp. 21MFCrub1.1]|uniref:gluconokinase n=1 Tax=Leifsonia sp. 21MFCrub1.1 TaxID=1798223 RepID=UPI0008929E2B|nr:gluconokinase [Leifsonia sp. 21MFCrub1.1]SEB08545.1 gluconokinase [Leifsonia sp. 21MFCrub1.1]